MGIDKLVDVVYGRNEELSSMLKRILVPGGLVLTVKHILKKEEGEQGYVNHPRHAIFLGSAVITDVVKTAMYVGVSTMVYYMVK